MDEQIEKILKEARTIAVVGLSDKPERASYRVSSYMQRQGFRIIPVNPTIQSSLGETSYPDLASVPEKIDLVDIFRRSEEVPPIVDQAIQLGVRAVWMQEGIVNEEAAAKAAAAGLDVVMDRCIMVEHRSRS